MKRTLGVAISVALLSGCREDETPVAPTSQALQAAAAGPIGFIEEPRIASYFAAPGPNFSRKVTFTGWVDFEPGKGEIDVQMDIFGNVPPENRTNLRLSIWSARPSGDFKLVDGRKVWRFSTGPFAPDSIIRFLAGILRIPSDPWPDGGTAKFYLYARRFGEQNRTLLRGRDRDGVKGKDTGPSLVFADGTFLLGQPKYLGKNGETGSNSVTTRKYYESVYVTRTGDAAPGQSISQSLPSLADFEKRYFNELVPGPQFCPSPFNLKVHKPPAEYFNKGDLGIGREMHCSFNFCSKETACYVRNFGDREGEPFFSEDMSESDEAILRNKPFATVAMVSRGLMEKDAPNKVFFVVYDRDGKLEIGEVALDNVRHNTFVPGNCIGCHGTSARMGDAKGEIPRAQFLPFDLQHGIDYYSRPGRSRAEQEATFKMLNRIVATTDLYTQAAAKALLNGFYGAVSNFDVNLPLVTWPSPTFKNDWVPKNDWNTTSSPRQIYKRVVAPYCRTCHISDRNSGFDFGTYDGFISLLTPRRNQVCGATGANIMPNAEITSHKFWQSDARAQLVQRAKAVFPGCGSE